MEKMSSSTEGKQNVHIQKFGPLLDAHTELHINGCDVLVWPFCNNAEALCKKDVEAAAWQRPQTQRLLTEANETKRGSA